MRLTICLCSGMRDVTVRRWKKVWACRGKIYDYPPRIPEALIAKGVQIVDMRQKEPELLKWIPPVDDPRFAEPVPPERETDWKAEPTFSHSSNVRLFEGVQQACLIAKAQHFEGFPSAVGNLIGTVDIPEKILMLQRSIMQSQVWNTDETKLPKPFDPRKPRWSWKRMYGITHLKSSQILMRNLLRLSRSNATDYPSLRNRKVVYDPFLYSYVNHKGKPIVMKESLDLLLTSDQMLPPFAGEDVIDASVVYKMPDMWPIFPTVDFVETNHYELNNQTGFKTEDKYTCPHTIVQYPRKYHWDEKHYRASQIMTCLMYTAALARRKYGDDVKTLPEPISIQHVLFEQDHFLFTFFQLNTLDLDSETGVKNLVWTADKSHLFRKVRGQPWMPKAIRYDYYENFNPSAFDQFLAVYFNGVPEVSMRKT